MHVALMREIYLKKYGNKNGHFLLKSKSDRIDDNDELNLYFTPIAH